MTRTKTDPDFYDIRPCVTCDWSRASSRYKNDKRMYLCTNRHVIGPPSIDLVTGEILNPAHAECQWERTDIGECGVEGKFWTARSDRDRPELFNTTDSSLEQTDVTDKSFLQRLLDRIFGA